MNGSKRKNLLWVAGAAVLAWSVSGCTGHNQVTVSPASPVAGRVMPLDGGPKTTPLGTAQEKDDLRVTLTAAEDPHVGQTPFVATVNREGKPATRVMVSMAFSQREPLEPGPAGAMGVLAPGSYRYVADLNAPGTWIARVTVVTRWDSQSFFYTFNVDA